MNPLKGVFTALITPFQNGKIDFASLERLLARQLAGGIDGFVVNGTTAESPTLSEEEVADLFSFVRKKVGAKVPLILGTGSNSTEDTIAATRRAEQWGADAALVVVPYYNKPPQRGLFAHFKAVADATRLPILLYNVPGRTITSLELETIRKLSEIENIVGIKEASGKIEFASEIRKACGKDFVLLSGDDGTYAKFLEAGGDGVISVASHILPEAFSRWTKALHQGDAASSLKEIPQYAKVIDLLFVEANPIPVKKALQFMGVIQSASLRLPLVEMDEKLALSLKEEMVRCGILK
ncbi:MAG TPA: 4-hydroxy-tetrahydrodipicolinate synthase [Pseudobdellovibrionaceae bacterium]|nr:4-hydroxy-tetrahydrodipicolinate synthase [Pseudobdellovibrionaceae bacterium]